MLGQHAVTVFPTAGNSGCGALQFFPADCKPCCIGNGRQTATLETPSTQAKVMGKDVVWNCAGNACNAPRGNARPAISCSALVKQAGKVTAFAVGGVALDEAALTRCNSFAR